EQSTGSNCFGRFRPRPTGTTALRRSSDDVGSVSEHGDGEDVTGVHQRMDNRELSTPPCSPNRQTLPACPMSVQGNPVPPRPEGSRTSGGRPNGPIGTPRATRWLKTVWSRPLGKAHHCSVFRNGPAWRSVGRAEAPSGRTA